VISLIPISDANPTRTFPIVTVLLILLNIVAFFFLEPDFGGGDRATKYFVDNVAIPCQLEDKCDAVLSQFSGVPPELSDPPERSLLSFVGAIVFSTFLHGGFFHIAGNMLFLWVFGNNIEDFLGKIKYVLFYLAAGIAAGFAQVLTNLNGVDSIIPAVGASGAVAGVMGAYLVLHPRARINCLVPLFIFWTVIQLSAWVVLGIWFVFQFFTGAASGIAWMAHVGGFVFGVVAIFLLGGRPQRPQHLYYEPIPRF
jgi:membrane associated rhomboid family serine protease